MCQIFRVRCAVYWYLPSGVGTAVQVCPCAARVRPMFEWFSKCQNVGRVSVMAATNSEQQTMRRAGSEYFIFQQCPEFGYAAMLPSGSLSGCKPPGNNPPLSLSFSISFPIVM